MNSQTADDYRSYLLRIWKENHPSGYLWRASLESAQSAELRNFTDMEELFDFLRDETSIVKPRQTSKQTRRKK